MRPPANRSRELAVLLAGCALVYLTGLGDVPFYTRGEPREGNVVREMLRTGQWLVPERPEGEPARKPPLYYWAAALAWSAFPDRPEFAMRLPSAVLATAGVAATFMTTRAAFGAAAGLPAAIVLATAFEWTRAAVSARVDMALAAGTTMLLLAWTMSLARGGGWWWALATLGAIAGTLAKGPVAIIIPGLAVVVMALLERDRRVIWELRAPVVLGVAAVVVACWYGAAIAREGSAYWTVLLRENLLRFVDAEKGRTGHHAPTWYLFAVGAVGFLPWTPLVPLGFAGSDGDASPERRRVVRFATVWSAVILVFFSLASAKRSVYLLPLFPAVAMLVGAGVATPPQSGRALAITRALVWLIPPALVLLALVTGIYAAGVDPAAMAHHWLREDDRAGAAALAAAAAGHGAPLAALAVATAVVALALLPAIRASRWRMLVLGLGSLTGVWVAAFSGLLHPSIAHDRSLREFMQHVAQVVPEHESLHAFYPPDPGLRFYASRPLRAWPRGGPSKPGYLVVWEDEWRTLRNVDGSALPLLAVSTAEQPGRGHLALVATVPGPLRRVPPPAGDDPGGLRAVH